MTFSIVANVGEAFGVAVASKFLAVGSVVPAARNGTGAVASQAFADVSWKARALSLVDDGRSPEEIVQLMCADNKTPGIRQLGLVSGTDQATYTGEECPDWAGGRSGRDATGGYAIQGNILIGEQVVQEVERAWLDGVHLRFENRLTYALLAGDRAGGDRRGRQSAALYAVSPGTGYDHSGVLIDLRIDDHPEAVTELARLVDLNELYFGAPGNVLPLRDALADEVRARLDILGHRREDLEQALGDWAAMENYEMRLSADGIDSRVLQALREATPPDAKRMP